MSSKTPSSKRKSKPSTSNKSKSNTKNTNKKSKRTNSNNNNSNNNNNNNDSDSSNNDVEDDLESTLDDNKPMQDGFNYYDLAEFLRILFNLKPGKVNTLIPSFRSSKVSSKQLVEVGKFLSNRACLEVYGKPEGKISDKIEEDKDATVEIYDFIAAMVETNSTLRKAMDPHYVFVDWGPNVPPVNYSAAGGTLAQVKQLVNHAAAPALPVAAPGGNLRLITAGCFNALQTNNAVQAGIVIGFINNEHPNAADSWYVVATLPAQHY